MKVRIQTLAATMALAGLCSTISLPAHALGFGGLRVQSEIYQPLRAEVDLRLGERESLADVTVRQAPVSEYQRQGVNFPPALANLRVELQNQGGRAVALLTTPSAINSAGLQFILQSVSSQGKVLRTFTLQLSTSALSGPTASQGMKNSGAFTATMVAAQPLPESPPLYKSRDNSGIASIYTNVIEIGNRPATRMIDRVSGAGTTEPLAKTLVKIVPSKWKGFAGDSAMKSSHSVSWIGDSRVWVSVLDQVMSQSSMTATVDWDRKEVTFRGLDMTEEPMAVKTASAEPAPPPQVTKALAINPPAAVVAQTNKDRLAAEKSHAEALEQAARIAEEKRQADVMVQANKDRLAAEKSHAEALEQAARIAEEKRQADVMVQANRDRLAAEKSHAEALEQAARIAEEKRQADVLAQANEDRLAAEKAQKRAQGRALAEIRVKAQNERIDAEEAVRKAQSLSAGPADPAVSPVLTSLTLKGDVLNQLHTVTSAGAGADLFPVLSLIAPPGWVMSTEDKAIFKMTGVSWHGDAREWLLVLNEILVANSLKAVINANDKRIYLMR